MKALTVNDLLKECQKQIKAGNGNRSIMISQDDEGNGYHYLWYSFSPIEQLEEPVKIGDKEYPCKIETDERIAKHNDTIILG